MIIPKGIRGLLQGIGQIPFAKTVGFFVETAAEFVWNNTTKRLGVGIGVPLARLHVKGPVEASANPPAPVVKIEGGAHTAMGNSDAPDVLIDLARTITFTDADALTEYGAVRIKPPTLAEGGGGGKGSDIATAATLIIDGPPAAGANMSITDPLAVWAKGEVLAEALQTTNGIIAGAFGGGFANQRLTVAGKSSLNGDVTIGDGGFTDTDVLMQLANGTFNVVADQQTLTAESTDFIVNTSGIFADGDAISLTAATSITVTVPILGLTVDCPTSQFNGTINCTGVGVLGGNVGVSGGNITTSSGILSSPGHKDWTVESVVTAATTNATPTLTGSFSHPAAGNVACLFHLTAWVTAFNSAGPQGASYVLMATYRKASGAAGALTLIGTINKLHEREDNAAWDVTIDHTTTAGAFRFSLTGAAATNINWQIRYQLERMF